MDIAFVLTGDWGGTVLARQQSHGDCAENARRHCGSFGWFCASAIALAENPLKTWQRRVWE